MRFFWVVALLVVLCGGCSSESFTDLQKPGTPLIDSLESYASKNAVLSQLKISGSFDVLENSSLPDGDGRPPFSVLTLQIKSFTHLNQGGRLELRFFNDRLQRSTFYPSDPTSYQAELVLRGLDVRPGHQTEFGNTVMSPHVDLHGQFFVVWADQRLQAQSGRWIKRYS